MLIGILRCSPPVVLNRCIASGTDLLGPFRYSKLKSNYCSRSSQRVTFTVSGLPKSHLTDRCRCAKRNLFVPGMVEAVILIK